MFDGSGWDAGLDSAQLAAVTHDQGPLVVVAGAGTGKTRTLTARVARLLERGTPPERILLLTFTRRAADDMLSRAAALSGRRELGRRLRGGTFHAVAHQMIAAHAEPLGLRAGFSVIDPADAADLMDLLRSDGRLDAGEYRVPHSSTLVDVYSRCVNTRRPLRQVLATDFPWCEPLGDAIAALFRQYVARKQANDQVDFDDLLLLWGAALASDVLGKHLAGMFDYVLVDEYQDVNALQVDIVRLLRPGGHGLTVVGDDAQAVYGFRGADACHLHELTSSTPDVTVVRLEANFRSLQAVLDVANAARPAGPGPRLVLRGTRGHGRRSVLLRCHDAPAEARAVVDRILDAHEQGMRLRDQAVLVRAAHHSDLVELELAARSVPYRKYGGLRFLEAAHVKDLVAAMRVLDNPADEVAWFRLLRLHGGIGPARARGLLATLAPRCGRTGGDWAEVTAAAPARVRVALSTMFEQLDSARTMADVAARARAVGEVIGPLVESRYVNGPRRASDIRGLVSAVASTEDIARWLAELVLDPPVSTAQLAGPPHLDEDYLVISTVHSAKGLEWRAVHLPHLVDGAFPSDMASSTPAGLAEERRLFYVAATRARDQLTMYQPLRMPHHRRAVRDDRHSFAAPSRFLDDGVLRNVDVQHQPSRASPPASASDAPRVTVELDALWG